MQGSNNTHRKDQQGSCWEGSHYKGKVACLLGCTTIILIRPPTIPPYVFRKICPISRWIQVHLTSAVKVSAHLYSAISIAMFLQANILDDILLSSLSFVMFLRLDINMLNNLMVSGFVKLSNSFGTDGPPTSNLWRAYPTDFIWFIYLSSCLKCIMVAISTDKTLSPF